MTSVREGRAFTSTIVLATLLTEAASIAQTVFEGQRDATVAIVLVPCLLAATSLAAFSAVDAEKLALARALAGLDVALCLGMVVLSRTYGFLAPFPVIAVVYTVTRIEVTIPAVVLLAGAVAVVGGFIHLSASVIVGHFVGFMGGACFIMGFTRVAIAERRARAELERMKHQVEELATARERSRIAREIHDGLGHALTAVHVQLEAARALVARSPERTDALDCIVRAQACARQALQEARRSVTMLRTTVALGSLADAVRGLAEDCRGDGISVDVTIEGVPRPLPPAAEFALYRAVQEALTNVRRHASTTTARVALAFAPSEAHVRICDDGLGRAETAGAGYGLIGMRERAELLGGRMEVRSAPGEGFEVFMSVPS